MTHNAPRANADEIDRTADPAAKSGASRPNIGSDGIEGAYRWVASPAEPQHHGPGEDPWRLAVLTVPRQRIEDEAAGGEVAGEAGAGMQDAHGPAWTTSIRTAASIVHLLQLLAGATEDYLAFSHRPGLIWDRHLLVRIRREVAAVERLGVPWFALTADGIDLAGRPYSAAFFNYEPTLLPDRGRRQIVQSAGTLFVIKRSSLRALGVRRTIAGDLLCFMNDLVVLGYARGLGSFFTSGLYPCLTEHRGLTYRPVQDQMLSFNPANLLAPAEAEALFPAAIVRHDLLTAWFNLVAVASRAHHRFSFVIRTLFRRKHLLHRCLISIDYLRSSLNIEVEIVIASDVESVVSADRVTTLSENFPRLRFVTADGRLVPGHSRVRNLIAGIRATTGTRVCIIDDDDYYTPQAVTSFEQACTFGCEELLIFDTQIIVERWLHVGVKSHKEIVAYRDLYAAKRWAMTLRGTNSIPLCGIIHPGWFVRQVAYEYKFDFDYSEDFIFHLHCLTHGRRPPIRTVDSIGAYQSHRQMDDNVSNLEDRSRWITDTGNGLYQLLFEEGRTLEAMAPFDATSGEARSHQDVHGLERELADANERRKAATEALADLVGRAGRRESALRSQIAEAEERCRSATQALADLVQRTLARDAATEAEATEEAVEAEDRPDLRRFQFEADDQPELEMPDCAANDPPAVAGHEPEGAGRAGGQTSGRAPASLPGEPKPILEPTARADRHGLEPEASGRPDMGPIRHELRPFLSRLRRLRAAIRRAAGRAH